MAMRSAVGQLRRANRRAGRRMGHTARAVILMLAMAAWGCSRPGAATHAGPQASAGLAAFPPPAYEAALPAGLRAMVDKPFTGDLDQMVKRRLIRVGAPFNRTFYFVDGGVQRGLSYEYAKFFEDQLNKQFNTGNLRVNVILLPMRRDELVPQLLAGKIDAVFAQQTVTPSLQKLVAFSIPTRTNVDEVLVTGPAAPQIKSLADLGAAKVPVRASSSAFSNIAAYNARQKSAGRPQLAVEAAPESLEDDDLLEMVNAGLIPATVVDNYLAAFWKQVFPNLVVHGDLPLRTGGQSAVAYRKEDPQLGAELNGFIAKNGLDSAFGRVIEQRYLQNTKYVTGAAQVADRKRFLDMVELFRKYGDEYSFDYLLMAAQGYQESGLNQDAKSPVGAIGVMQLMPKTGAAQNVGDIHKVDANIHAGVKYMRFMRDQYFQGQPMDDLNKGLFTFAAYNAGAGKIDQLRREAAGRGLNPNVWFGNVERIASERIGRETVTYVSNIYKYYVAYKLIAEQQAASAAAEKVVAAEARR
jgi:membrane-bound lytic murein transglycosylase MltF